LKRGKVKPLPRLIALSPGELEQGGESAFLRALRGALAAGLPGLLLRESRLMDRAYLALAREVVSLCTAHGTPWLGVHDRAHLAAEVGADAVHLSFRSLRPAELRTWLDPSIALGLSTHADDAPAAWREADYLFHGPLHATPSKVGRLEPVGLAGLERALAHATRPVLALGGVTPRDVPPLRRLGVHGVAVRAGVLGAADPAGATRAYLEALG